MKKSIISVIAVCMLMAFATSAFTQDWSNEQKEVWQAVKDGWVAWQKGDLENAMTGFHEKFQGWNSEYPLPANKKKVIGYYKMMKEYMTVVNWDIEPARIVVVDNAAVVHYYFSFYATYQMGDKKKEESVSGKNAEFYIKEKGVWMLLGDMTFIDDEDD